MRKDINSSAGYVLQKARKTFSGGRNGGRKPSCTCGKCKKCKDRKYQREWRAKQATGA